MKPRNGPLQGIRGVLLDIDGTLLEGDHEIPGAAAALDRLRAAGLPFRLATNTSRRSRGAIATALGAAGLRVEAGEVLTPAALACRRILDSGRTRAVLLVPEEARADLPGIDPDEERPAWVVLGDLGPGFTYERMNGAFRCLRQGAGLLALHRNRFWHAGEQGWVLDVGASTGRRSAKGSPRPPFGIAMIRTLGEMRPEELVRSVDDVQPHEEDVAP